MRKIKYLGFIPARSGSKGVIKKNVHLLAGKPLIVHTFEKAEKSVFIDEIHLSTDSEDIIDHSKKFSVKSFYKRPKKISCDKTSAIDVIFYHLDWLRRNRNIEVENIIYLQPTSPIRSENLIDNTIKKYELRKSKSIVTICECTQHPFEMIQIINNKIVESPNANGYIRRQDFPNYYFVTGSVYIRNVDKLYVTKKLIDKDTDYYMTSIEEGIDIDTLHDFNIAETILSNSLYK